MAILDEARLKLRRGKEHLYVLEAETRKFWDSDPYTLVHERNGQDFPNLLRFKLTQPIPYHTWGLILGDAVHNVRSALDYIVWRLAGSHLEDRTSMFPIYAIEDNWKNTQWRFKEWPIHPGALAYIQSLQPYARPDPKRAKLWILQEFDARDKHKLIATTQSIARASHIGGVGQMQIPTEVVEGTIKDGAVIIEYADPPEACMNMKFEFAYRIIFERGVISDSEDFEVLSCLYGIAQAVDVIIDNFELRPNWFP
jgi:hypothetical protein